MAKGFVIVLALVLTVSSVHAQRRPRIFIEAKDGFDVYVSAALSKKDVGVDVVTDQTMADYVMKASEVEVQKVSTGSKFANCIFASCAGNADKGNTSVQVVDREGVVKWSYAVNKGRGEKNKQALAEAIAKHFKSEFLRKH
jgi:hypothetical protein